MPLHGCRRTWRRGKAAKLLMDGLDPAPTIKKWGTRVGLVIKLVDKRGMGD
jgi:hypothetical protein